MRMMFVDESKHNHKKSSHFFVLVGIIIDGNKLLDIEAKIRTLKENHSIKNLKALKNSKRELRIIVTHKLVDILKEYDGNVKILGAVIKNKGKNLENYIESYLFIMERFFLELHRQGEHGIIIQDHFDSRNLERTLQNKINSYVLTYYVTFGKKTVGCFLDRIYPTVLFMWDEHSEILQVADLVATSLGNAVWRSIEKEGRVMVEQLKDYNIYLREYWDLFVKRPNDRRINGWGIKVWDLPIQIG